MKDFTKNFKDGLNKTSQFLKSSSEDLLVKLREGAEKLGTLGPAAKDKIIDLVNDVVAILPLLNEAGYRTNEFKIGVALNPTIEISFARLQEVLIEDLAAFKAEHKDKRLFNLILGMLETAHTISTKLDTEDFTFYETVVEIGVPPSVSLRYINRNLDPMTINLLD